MITRSLSRFAVGLMLMAFFIILWGAWVRISGSGDGCGSHWPFCHGEVIPKYRDIAMLIEYLHRLTSKLFGVATIIFVWWVFRRFEKGEPARKWAVATLFFTITEGLLGALLVLKGLVGQEDSVLRSVVMAFHLINTFLLTGSLVISWVYLRYERISMPRPLPSRASLWRILGVLVLWVLLNASGALAALAATLFPSTNLLEGFNKDLASASHFTLRLRILHPFFAALFAGLAISTLSSAKTLHLVDWHRGWINTTLILIAINLVVGPVTLGLLSPTYLKLLHLLMAHLIWIGLAISFFPFFHRQDHESP